MCSSREAFEQRRTYRRIGLLTSSITTLFASATTTREGDKGPKGGIFAITGVPAFLGLFGAWGFERDFKPCAFEIGDAAKDLPVTSVDAFRDFESFYGDEGSSYRLVNALLGVQAAACAVTFLIAPTRGQKVGAAVLTGIPLGALAFSLLEMNGKRAHFERGWTPGMGVTASAGGKIQLSGSLMRSF